MNSLLYFCALCVILSSPAYGYRWCCKSIAEFRKCSVLSGGNSAFQFSCVLANGTADCMDKIAHDTADIIDLDSGDVFKYRDQITVIGAEDYGNGVAKYHAIAVVRKNADPSISLHNLAHRRTCHTAVGKTAGWNMPIGWMIRNNISPSNFDSSCAPGAMDPEHQDVVPDNDYEKWCRNCIGDVLGRHVCDRDQDERFYGYDGAFDCMSSGSGDVAFIKETIILKKDFQNYMLLCPDSPRRASPLEWRNCNLGRVPSHGVVMKRGTSADVINHTLEILRASAASIHNFSTLMGKNLLWSSSTRGFVNAPADPQEFLGHDFFCNTYSITYGEPHQDC
uniref:Serotransferrin-A n=1 Tax=Ciona intestinalis TaxID=7719 RepID=H2Y0R9_CIOIN|nr:serotransferrin-A [Ciona intestinalis]|eukprot:XP_002123276.1 serotransferrin-A [Ciona intestinalis]